MAKSYTFQNIGNTSVIIGTEATMGTAAQRMALVLL